VVEAYGLAESRRNDMEVADRRVRNAEEAFRLDVERARNLKGLPIESLDSLRQINAARQELIRSVVQYNQAQFRLWAALGRPPLQALTGGADCP
jgi:outer membrane protein TolC